MEAMLGLAGRMMQVVRRSRLPKKFPKLPTVKISWLLVSAVLLALICGLLIAADAYPILILLVLLIAGPVLVFKPRLSVWIGLVGSMGFTGLAELYMPSLSPLKWGVALLVFSLPLVAGFQYFFASNRAGTVQNHSAKPFVGWATFFFLVFAISSLANWNGGMDALVGFKGYFQMWGLMLMFYYINYTAAESSRLIKFLLMLAICQIPFVLHQFLFLVPLRMGLADAAKGIVAVDIVAGTFGGTMSGGGRSSSLALLEVIAITLVVAQWRVGKISSKRAALLSIFFLIPIALCEAKIILLLFPASFFLLFKDRVKTDPLKFLLGGFLTVILVGLVFVAYSSLPGAKGQRRGNVSEDIVDSVAYNFGNRGYGNAVLNRTSVYPFWIKEHAHIDEIGHVLIGHGPGETNSSSLLLDATLATKRYAGYAIGLTGISSILWELGLGGVIGIIGILWVGYRQAAFLELQWKNTPHWPFLKTAEVAIVLYAINLFHNNYFVSDISFQALLFVVLGYLIAMTNVKRDSP